MSALSAWRVSDAALYAEMREAATTLTALLTKVVRSNSDAAAEARVELEFLQSELLRVDGFDRQSVASLANSFSERIQAIRSTP